MPEQRILALLVGINDYSHVEKFDCLKGPKNDIRLMRNLLVDKLGIKSEDVLTLTECKHCNPDLKVETELTHEGIAKAFRRHLINQATPDDICIFYFSGHGSKEYTSDTTNEVDSQNETLVPCDSRDSANKVSDILDDELFLWLQELGENDPQIILIIDSCHSGTIVRDAVRKDIEIKGGPPDTRNQLPGRNYSIRRSLQKNTPSQWLPLDARYVLLSACEDKERAKCDLQENGQFCSRFTRNLDIEVRHRLENHSFESTSYFDLIQGIRSRIKLYEKKKGYSGKDCQNPQAEGSLLTQQVFGTRLLQTYYSVTEVDEKTGRMFVKINAGKAHAIESDMRFNVYPIDCVDLDDDASLLGSISDLKVDLTQSEGFFEPSGPIKIDSLIGSKLIVAEYSKKLKPLSVHLSRTPEMGEELEEVLHDLAGSGLIQLSSQKVDVNLAVSFLDGEIIFEIEDQQYIMTVPDQSAEKSLSDTIAQIARYHNVVREYEPNHNAHLANAVQIVVRRGDIEAGEFREKEQLPSGVELKSGDLISVHIFNHHQKPLFCSLLECLPSPGFEIRPLYPLAVGAMDNRVSRKASRHLGVFELAEPFGITILKLIATSQPSDFTNLLQPRMWHLRLRGESAPVKLFRRMMAGIVGRFSFGKGVWSTDTFQYSVKKA